MSNKLKAQLGFISRNSILAFGEEEDAKAKADADAKAKVDAEAKAKVDAEAKIKADADAKIKADADAKAKVDAGKKTIDLNIKVDVPKVEKDKTYTSDEVAKIINDSVKAGSVNAKKQLYDEIDKLKVKVTETENALKKDPESNKLKEDNIELSTKLKILEDEVTKAVLGNEQLTETLHNRDISAHKEKLISAANGRIVPELITGNTIEELDASAKVAAEKYEEYSEKVRKEYNLPKEPVLKPGEEGKREGELKVDRIDPRDPKSIKDWDSKKKAVTDEIWSRYLVK